jgi:predicted nucleic acid-binding protein
MKKFVVDAGVVLHLVAVDAEVSTGYKLLAPTLLRSQTLSLLHEAVQRGKLSAEVARDRVARVGRMPIRLLGDGKLRRTAWDVASLLGMASTYDAEYLALTQLQADAFVTLDAKLARVARAVVEVASIDELVGRGRRR